LIPLELGGQNRFIPFVLGPSRVPEIADETQAIADPELAVLSAMAHGQDADTGKAVQIALAAQLAIHGLDEDRSKLYVDLVLTSLSEAARKALRTMDPAKYQYQSDFAKNYVAQGETSGRAALVIKQLTSRFGPLTDAVQTTISEASIAELDAIGVRLLTAQNLQDALGPH